MYSVIKNKRDQLCKLNLERTLPSLVVDILVIVFISLFSSTIGLSNESTQSLVAHDESLYSARAKYIFDSDDWLTPFGHAHHKTIGSYWLIAISYKLVGLSDFSARLPSALCALMSLITLYLICKQFFPRRVALLASTILPTMPLWHQYSRYASPDMAFIFIILASFLFIAYALNNKSLNRLHVLLLICTSGVFFGLTFFVRSYMSFLPLIASAPLILIKRDRIDFSIILAFFTGYFLGLIPTGFSIFIAIQTYGIEAINKLFDFAQNKVIGSDSSINIFSYPLSLLLLSYPTGLFAPLGIAHIIQGNYKKERLFFVYYPGIILILLMLMSTYYNHYSLILYPFIGVLSAISLEKLIFNSKISPFSRYSNVIALIFIVIGSVLISVICLQLMHPQIIDFKLDQKIMYGLMSLSLINIFSGIVILRGNSVQRDLNLSFLLNSFMQLLILSISYSFGIIGNPNKELKSFVANPAVENIVASNFINIVGITGKDELLLRFYLPNSGSHKAPLDEILVPNYSVISSSALSTFNSLNYKVDIISTYRDKYFVRMEQLYSPLN